jgi:uncharacterized protein (DUF433 family)
VKQRNQPPARMIGRFIVADPEICHGKPTFRGTRVLVSDVLEQVASGESWQHIEAQWKGSVPADAIAEAVRLASQALLDHAGQYAAPEYALERVRV